MPIDYNELTGREIVELGGQVKTPERVNSDRTYARKKRSEYKRTNEQFIMVKERYKDVKIHLSLEQNGVLMFMVSLMKHNSEGLLFHNSKKVGFSELANLIGKSERQVTRVIEELEKLSLVVREKDGRKVVLSLGENFFHSGYSDGSFKFVKLYKTRLKEIAQNLSLSELGLLMYMVSHFHYDINLLVDNPQEKDKSKLLIWKRKHVAEEFDVSIDFVKRAFPKLRKVRAIYEVKSAKNGIVLDPSLVCIGNKPKIDDILDAIDECEFKKDNVKK
ncbi:hypothetical protein GLW07_18955 [Bacillus hwajinpoensis]|uniref:Uncharacterized protein n=1 Tax=Guptibacillus hwajinpoensis TaxID=208199 RepID=A0A845F315_9BACL|nr:hypothetical protein [Pseudalkalibacillus hwajinpoensis]MYL65442.1 hypothetical protein [Pseudalkalibacillus hwajinpoensis]